MAKKTVINRLCKMIGNTSTDGNIAETSDRLDEIENVDMVQEDVVYEIEKNANAKDFTEVEAEVVADAEVVEDTKLPDFMSQE